MASTITFIPQDDDADRILDAFEQRTGLSGDRRDDDGARIYELDGEDHRVEVVQTLDGVDPAWNRHVMLESPA
jgi:hypothetical protein